MRCRVKNPSGLGIDAKPACCHQMLHNGIRMPADELAASAVRTYPHQRIQTRPHTHLAQTVIKGRAVNVESCIAAPLGPVGFVHLLHG
jgi:hypothetical protein